MLPETVRKGEFRRTALSPMPDGRSRWGYPPTFLTSHTTGFWMSVAVPRLEERVSRSTWAMCLNSGSRRNAAGGLELDDYEQVHAIPPSKYPSGRPLTLEESKACRWHRPKILVGGRFLCWDFSRHGGCRSPMVDCPMGNHEIIKTKGLRPLMQMQLVRRGGHLARKRVEPKDIAGHAQALRAHLKQVESPDGVVWA